MTREHSKYHPTQRHYLISVHTTQIKCFIRQIYANNLQNQSHIAIHDILLEKWSYGLCLETFMQIDQCFIFTIYRLQKFDEIRRFHAFVFSHTREYVHQMSRSSWQLKSIQQTVLFIILIFKIGFRFTYTRIVYIADGLTSKYGFNEWHSRQKSRDRRIDASVEKVQRLQTLSLMQCFFAHATFVHVQKVPKNFLHRKFFLYLQKRCFLACKTL